VFLLFSTPLFAQSIWTETQKSDWSDGVLVNTTWYPETQIQLDWQGSSFTTTGNSPSELWLAGWKFRRKITINNSLSYGLSDYQVWIPTGAFGSDWTLIRSSAQPTMADFRFTPSTATTTLPYWIDSDTTSPNGFRVRISTLPVGNTTIYMYYGNPSAVVGSSVTAVWGSGLVGYWAFGEGTGTIAKDASGNNNNGTLTNGPAWVNGKYGKALSFDGTDDYVAVGSFNPTPTNALTVEAWVYWNSFSQSWSRIIDFGNGQGNDNILFAHQLTAGDLVFEIYNSGGTSGGKIVATGTLTTGQWLHLAATINSSGNVVLFKNGLAIQSGTSSLAPASIARTLNYIARSNWTADGYFNGMIDDLRIYNRVLTADEIKSHYVPTEPTISSVGSEEGVFFSTASYRSNVLDTGGKVVVSSVSWSPVTQPAGTNLTVGIRVSSAPFSINSSTPPFVGVSNGQSLNWSGRYIQYISTFTTSVSTATPRLEDISIVYRVKPFKEKSVVRSGDNSFGFGGGESWEWQLPVKSGLPLTITAYIRYNSYYGSVTKPKLTIYGKGITTTSVSATSAAENAWELLTINAGTPSENAILKLKAEGFSTNPGARFYIDDVKVSQ